ncbi:MAG: hypothetical protein AAF368_05085 [Planctomycetota bacterium]
MKAISVRRNKGWYGRLRKLSVVVDGVTMAALRAGETLSLKVEESSRRIWGEMDWGRTEVLLLDKVRAGQAVKFDAYFTFNPLRAFAVQALPFRVFASD